MLDLYVYKVDGAVLTTWTLEAERPEMTFVLATGQLCTSGQLI